MSDKDFEKKWLETETLISNLPGIVYRCRNDRYWTMDYLSRGCLKLTGYEPEIFINNRQKEWVTVIHEDDRSYVWEIVQAALSVKEHFTVVYRAVAKNGEKYFWEQGCGVYDENGELLAIEGFICDISLYREVEKKLSLTQFGLDKVSNSVFRVNQNGGIVYANDMALKCFGLSREGFDDSDLGDILDFKPFGGWSKIWQQLEQNKYMNLVVECRGADGRFFWSESWFNFFEFSGERYCFLFVRDISRRKQLQENQWEVESRLLNARKMESLGRLSAGIAHDFNNLISPILCYSDLLLRDTSLPPQLREFVQGIQESGQKARKLSRKLVDLGRKEVVKAEELNLNKLILDFGEMFSSLLGEKISVRLDLCASPLLINCDAAQIEQILLNLLLNSRDAMPEGGGITIKTTFRKFCGEDLLGSEIPAGNYAVMCVSDIGVGMDRETRERIFEPFFTTKAAENGTGLGLSIVHGAVSRHGGYIHVYSEKAVGTRFMLYFPLCEQGELSELAKESEKNAVSDCGMAVSDDSVLKANFQILVVDDERPLRNLIVKILKKQGYSVLEAASFAEVEQILRDESPLIDLLLCDVMNPDGNGLDVYRALHEMQPEMRVLYMSGYTEEMVTERKLASENSVFLQKPFSVSELIDAVKLAIC
jgi:PAS domain S-box-containing protein